MPTHSGVIKSYNALNGWGFIACEEEGCDVYFKRSSLPEEFREFGVESVVPIKDKVVTFDVQHTKDGKPQALAIQLVAGTGEVMVGTVKSFNAMKGFGFIKCSSFEKDVYFQAKEVPDHLHGLPLEGVSARFMCKVLDDGNVQARDLLFNTLPMGVPPHMGMAAAPGSDKAITGVVKSFNPTKGFGFIMAPAVPGDIYFKADQVQGDVAEGEMVSCFLNWTPDGKPQAAVVTPCLEDGSEVVGVVKSYSDKNGWGFMAVDGQPSDVYFKSKDLPEEMQKMGDEIIGRSVQFHVQLTTDGKPQMRGDSLPKYLPNLGVKEPRGAKRPASFSRGGDDGAPVKRQRVVTRVGSMESFGMTKGFGFGFGGKGLVSRGPSMFAHRGGAGAGAGARAAGVVKSYNAVNGFGFIQSPAVSVGDVYFKRISLGFRDQSLPQDQVIGRRAAFTLKYALDGKPQAENVSLQ